MSNQTKQKVTWQCYPSNVESFEAVNLPSVNNVINSRKTYLEEVNRIDKLPNYSVPDDTGPVTNFNGPKNMQPVPKHPYESMSPIIVMTDVEPGMIMPGNISVNLPEYVNENPELIYSNSDNYNQYNANNSYHGDDILESPELTVAELKDSQPVNTPRINIDNNFYMAQPNVHNYPVSTNAPPEINMQVPNLQSVQAAVPLPTKQSVLVNSNLPSSNASVLNSSLLANASVSSKPGSVKSVAVENYPEAHKLNPLVINKKRHPVMHKLLMYISIALVIYLIYVLLFEK